MYRAAGQQYTRKALMEYKKTVYSRIILAAGIWILAFIWMFLLSDTCHAAGSSDLGIDSVDRDMMVRASDGYYYWLNMSPASGTIWEVRFKLNGTRITDESTVLGATHIDFWKDAYGCYVFNSTGFWENGHDIYTTAATMALYNHLYFGNGGIINVRIDYSGQLNAWSASEPVTNMYFKGAGYRTTRICNHIAEGNTSWANDQAIVFGSVFQLSNGSQSLRTRQLVFDGADHFTTPYSYCSNSVYISDGCSYYSYGDEFLHGYTSAIISNHHSSSATTCYGESYIKVQNAYFHDCLIGAVANNRLEIYDSTFSECVNAVSVGGSGGGSYAADNKYGSRLVLSGCIIKSSVNQKTRGYDPYGINIGGNYVVNEEADSVIITECTIDVANDDVHIDSLTGPRNIRITDSTIKDSYNSDNYGIYNNNTKGGITSFTGGKISGNKYGIYIVKGTVCQSGGNICENGWGIRNKDIFDMTGGSIYSNTDGGVYQAGTMYMSGAARVKSDNRLYLAESKIVNISGALTKNGCGYFDMTSSERKVGRLLVSVDYTADKNTRISQAERFGLWKTGVNYNSNGKAFTGIASSGCVRSAARDGVSGIDARYGFLSARYLLTYDGNLTGKNVTVSVPEADDFYWSETTEYDLSTRAVTNMPFTSTGWANRSSAKSPDYTGATKLTLTDNKTLYAVWGLGDVRFLYYGNGDTDCNEALAGAVSKKGVETDAAGQHYIEASDVSRAPQNPFIKEDECRYSFVGWSTSNVANYKSSGILAAGASTYGNADGEDYVTYIKNAIEDGRISYDYSGSCEIIFYAVWDRFPELATSDIYIYREAAYLVDEAYLYAHMKAFDREDGVIDGAPGLEILDFDPAAIMSDSEHSRYEISCAVTDGYGNTTEGNMTIHILTAGPLAEISYVRFIDAENYYKEREEGGLYDNSKWKLSECAIGLNEAFARLEKDSDYIISYSLNLNG